MDIKDIQLEFNVECEFQPPVSFLGQYFSAIYKDYMFFYTGYDTNIKTENNSNFRSFFKVHIPTGEVTRLTYPSWEVFRTIISMSIINDKIYCTGEHHNNNNKAYYSQNFLVYDIKNDTWTNLYKSSPRISARGYTYGCNLVRYDNLLYMFNGYNGSSWTNKYSVYNPETDELTELGNSSGVAGGMCLLIDKANKEEILSTVTSSSANANNCFYKYNFKTKLWNTKEFYTNTSGFNFNPYNDATSVLYPILYFDNKLFTINDGTNVFRIYADKLSVFDYETKIYHKNIITIPSKCLGIFKDVTNTSWNYSQKRNLDVSYCCRSDQANYWGNKKIFVTPNGTPSGGTYNICSISTVQTKTGEIAYTENKEKTLIETPLVKIRIEGWTPPKTEMKFLINKNDTYYTFKKNTWQEVTKDNVINLGMTIDEIEKLNITNFNKLVSVGDNISILVGMMSYDPFQSAYIKRIKLIFK